MNATEAPTTPRPTTDPESTINTTAKIVIDSKYFCTDAQITPAPWSAHVHIHVCAPWLRPLRWWGGGNDPEKVRVHVGPGVKLAPGLP